MPELVLKSIDKVYDNDVQAVVDFNLEINDKDFIVFVGPSGCGKSTTLRMIAGLEDITDGELYIDGKFMNDVEPKDRDIAMVFQSYALYPHMTVYDNMAFGLKVNKVPQDEIDRRVLEASKVLEIDDYLDRKPRVLSGGQRQRVALGRAIVRNSKLFLMDEPLSNLDAKLRVHMRSEIIKLHERLGSTTIYVTHDQTEAMTMATKIVVMKDGYIQQIGKPKEIYNNPKNMFVASFVGAPATNFLHGTIVEGDFVCEGQTFKLPEKYKEALKLHEGKEVVLGVRPENLHLEDEIATKFPEATFDYHVEVSELLGYESILHGKFGEQKLIAKLAEDDELHSNVQVELTMDLDKVYFFDAETENRII